MQILTYKKNEGLLSIEVTISGTPTWYYYYVEDQFHENALYSNKPKKHTLGEPHELIKLSHNWLVRLANPSDDDISCSVKIEWFQLDNGSKKSILIWTRTLDVPANSGSEAGDSLLRNPV